MKIEIEVADAAEGEAIKAGLSHPGTRAAVVVVGTLLPFRPEMQERILAAAASYLEKPPTH